MLKKVFLTLLMASSFNFNSQATAASIEKEEEEISSQILAELPLDVKSYILAYVEPSLTVGKKTAAEPLNIETKSALIKSLYGYYEDDARREIQLLFPAIKLTFSDAHHRFVFKELPTFYQKEILLFYPRKNAASLENTVFPAIFFENIKGFEFGVDFIPPTFNHFAFYKLILSVQGLKSLSFKMESGFNNPNSLERFPENKFSMSTVQKITYYEVNMQTTSDVIHMLSSIPSLKLLKLSGRGSILESLSKYNQKSDIELLDISYLQPRFATFNPYEDAPSNSTNISSIFANLAKAKNLRILNITGCKLQDRDLKPLLQSSLTQIMLSEKIKSSTWKYDSNKISDALQEQFKQAGITIIDPQNGLSEENEEEDELELQN